MHFSNVVFLLSNKVIAPCRIRVVACLPGTADTPKHNDVTFIDRESDP